MRYPFGDKDYDAELTDGIVGMTKARVIVCLKEGHNDMAREVILPAIGIPYLPLVQCAGDTKIALELCALTKHRWFVLVYEDGSPVSLADVLESPHGPKEGCVVVMAPHGVRVQGVPLGATRVTSWPEAVEAVRQLYLAGIHEESRSDE